MPDIEELLRRELLRVTGQVQPEQLRPLRDPRGLARRLPGHAPRPRGDARHARGAVRPRWVLPSALAASVAILAALTVLLTNPTATRPPVRPQAPGSVPRFYVAFAGHTANGSNGTIGSRFVVHASADGRVTGTVTMPVALEGGLWAINAAADDRTFIVSVETKPSGNALVVYRLPVSASGVPGRVTRIGSLPVDASVGAVALSPNGTRLALSLTYNESDVAKSYPGIETINLATRRTHTWTARSYDGYRAGTPSWNADDHTVWFPWVRLVPGTPSWSELLIGTMQLDTTAGPNLPSGVLLPGFGPETVHATGTGLQFHGLTLTNKGTGFVGVSCDTTGQQSGTVTEKIIEPLPPAGEFTHVIWERTARYTSSAGRQMDLLLCDSGLWSVDATGKHLLIDALGQFGRIDNGVFTPLPLPSKPSAVW
jgi:hypothetical protein